MAKATTRRRARKPEAEITYPEAPSTLAEANLDPSLVLGLVMKAMYVNGVETGTELRETLMLPGQIMRNVLEDGGEKGVFEVLGRAGEGTAASELRYGLTAKGRDWAVEALHQSAYIGPAPITLREYHRQIRRQRLANENVERDILLQSLSHLVVEDDFIANFGPAVNSGRSMLLYGPPGNGKTSLAVAAGRAFRDTIYIPYCIEIDGQIIKVYDETVHDPVQHEDSSSASPRITTRGTIDRRWVRCRRPVILTGGELSLEMLDLSFNEHSKFYEAPVQMKATGGLFIIDDFGRQLVDPSQVLNRWIIPLERRVDYLTLHTGKKFPVPFDELVIFSTNISPMELMDVATMRRIYYKIEVAPPTIEDFQAIFVKVCHEYRIDLPIDLLDQLKAEYYDKEILSVARYHPRWIVEHVVSRCDYEHRTPVLEWPLVAEALNNLYTAY